MGYRSCLGILRLGQRYSPERVDAAAARALVTGACSYQSVKSMLERGLDVNRWKPRRPDRPSPTTICGARPLSIPRIRRGCSNSIGREENTC